MRIIIAGGHGKIALRLERLLGSAAVGLVRNPAHVSDVEATGARAVVCDLERASAEELAAVLDGADAAVFAAGAGPGSGVARKDTVDRAASALLADTAERAGVRRFLQISSMGAGKPPAGGRDEVWAAYITAKTQAEVDLRGRDLDWTIVRPGGLTDDPGTGLVRLEPEVPRGTVPRDDVAAVLAELLRERAAVHRTLELVSGDTPVAEAVAALR
ncbi:NAD(P)H-binding protein [Nonomuraea roseoviolacea subsp. roseoviolacea]|uniref:NAD(P)H-binding protein n=1 Tax=Nonomuraea roseoviolacea TaxID=103837 RepID=UPI0031DDCB38